MSQRHPWLETLPSRKKCFCKNKMVFKNWSKSSIQWRNLNPRIFANIDKVNSLKYRRYGTENTRDVYLFMPVWPFGEYMFRYRNQWTLRYAVSFGAARDWVRDNVCEFVCTICSVSVNMWFISFLSSSVENLLFLFNRMVDCLVCIIITYLLFIR